MGIFSFLCRKPSYEVFGPQGGISTAITLPEGFNPASDKCPMVILMHGFMANKNMAPIKGLAKALAKEGIASIRFDFDAHGKSEGQFIKMTIANEIEDARAVLQYVKTLPYVSKIAFAGHSQGGVIAGMLAGFFRDDHVARIKLIKLVKYEVFGFFIHLRDQIILPGLHFDIVMLFVPFSQDQPCLFSDNANIV